MCVLHNSFLSQTRLRSDAQWDTEGGKTPSLLLGTSAFKRCMVILVLFLLLWSCIRGHGEHTANIPTMCEILS